MVSGEVVSGGEVIGWVVSGGVMNDGWPVVGGEWNWCSGE